MKKSIKISRIILSVVASLLIATLMVCFVACGEQPPATQPQIAFAVKVVDIDGETLVDENITAKKNEKLFDILNSKYQVKSTNTEQFGNYVTSIASSIVDPNWGLMIYENGALASTGIDGIVLDDNDNFEFKVECWNTTGNGFGGTMDSVDVDVDKTIYKFMKTACKTLFSARTTFQGSENFQHWLDMAVYMMKANGYDSSIFKSVANEQLEQSLKDADLSTLSGADWGKYFYSARLLDKDMTSFKTAYQAHVNSLSGNFSEWVSPFELSFAKGIDVSSEALTKLIDKTPKFTSVSWGPDGAVWGNTCLSIYKTFNATDFDFISEKANYGNITSTALPLMLYSANNMKIREIQSSLEFDTVELLFANYFDESSGLLLRDASKPITDSSNFSVNQVYASLMSYKVQRDLNKSVNLFA